MRKLAAWLVIAVAISGCTKKNVSAHSTILGWDVPQSLVSESDTSKTTLNGIAANYQLTCGDFESFDLIQGSPFPDEFEKMLTQKGYKKTAGPNLDTSSIFLLTGPKNVLSYVSPQKFAICELN